MNAVQIAVIADAAVGVRHTSPSPICLGVCPSRDHRPRRPRRRFGRRATSRSRRSPSSSAEGSRRDPRKLVAPGDAARRGGFRDFGDAGVGIVGARLAAREAPRVASYRRRREAAGGSTRAFRTPARRRLDVKEVGDMPSRTSGMGKVRAPPRGSERRVALGERARGHIGHLAARDEHGVPTPSASSRARARGGEELPAPTPPASAANPSSSARRISASITLRNDVCAGDRSAKVGHRADSGMMSLPSSHATQVRPVV